MANARRADWWGRLPWHDDVTLRRDVPDDAQLERRLYTPTAPAEGVARIASDWFDFDTLSGIEHRVSTFAGTGASHTFMPKRVGG
jgi:hypothetical protein